MSDQIDKSPVSFRLLVESSAATISALSVAPAISIVDKAIVSNASGREKLLPCIINGVKSLFLQPGYFLRQPSFLFIWGVYSGTYIVANSIEALCERSQQSPFYPKFIGSSMANVTLSVLKDKAFARMFGQVTMMHFIWRHLICINIWYKYLTWIYNTTLWYKCRVILDLCLCLVSIFLAPEIVWQFWLHFHCLL